MGNVVHWPGVTKLDLPVERILDRAAEAKLSGALVVGWTEDGEFYAASSYADGGDLLWLLEMTKRKLFEAADALGEGQ